MSFTLILYIAIAVIILLIVGFVAYKKVPRKLKVEKYINDWKELQSYCKNKTTWPDAILEADRLLDKALKRRKFKGKRMGERMVAAQRMISNNDQMWFAHNLAKKVAADPAFKLKEADVKSALVGFRQALRDIGALRAPEQAIATEPQPEKGSDNGKA